MTRDLKTKLSRSNIRLMVDKQRKGWGFYATILFNMPMIEKDDIPTMATDGENIFYNAEWSDQLTEGELDFVRCHEGMHRALFHHARLQERDKEVWNIATVYVSNAILVKSGMEMPKSALDNPKYYGMNSEKVYRLLMDKKSKDGADGIPKPCEWGQVLDRGNEMTPDEIKQEESLIKQQIVMATQSVKSIGDLPNEIKTILTEMESSQVDWSSVIRRVIGGDQPEDYTYRRPNRRALNCFNIYNPSTLKVGVGDVVVWIDTSPSVSDKELSHALGELNAISEDMQPNSITIIYGDSDVQKVDRHERGDIIDKLNVHGRGGTNPMPIFKHIEDNDMNVDSMVCITDMGFHNYPKDVPYPLLWVSTDLSVNSVPIGEITYLNV